MSLARTTKSDIVKSIGDALLYDNMVNRKIDLQKNKDYRCPNCGLIKKVNEAHFENKKSIGCFTALIA